MNIKKLKVSLGIVFCVLAVIALSRFCHHQTEGFRLTKIRSNLLNPSDLATTSEKDQQFLQCLFKQKFSFLGRGLQSFVFASEDGQYVLKVFNNRYPQKISYFSFLSHFPFVGQWAAERAAYYQKKWIGTFASYQLAFSEMKDQTGLIYVHLNATTDLPKTLTLVDKIHIAHQVDPNQTGFLVQKMAKMVFPALKEYIAHKDDEGAKQALKSLVNLFFWKWRHAILDNDPLIRTNYGYIDGQAIQIDVGPLSKATAAPNQEYRDREIHRITESLKFWLTENRPELVPYLDQELQQQLSS